MFAFVKKDDFVIVQQSGTADCRYLHATERSTGRKILFKRRLAGDRSTLQEFQVHKKACQTTAAVQAAYQLLRIDGFLYIALEHGSEPFLTFLSLVRSDPSPVQSENESLLVHHLLQMISTLNRLHSVGITHGNVTVDNIWERNENKFMLGGMEKAETGTQYEQFERRANEDCKMVGVLLAEVVTNRFDLHTPSSPDRARSRLGSFQQRATGVYYYLKLLAESLLPGDRTMLAQALENFQIYCQSSLPATIHTYRCVICKNRKPDTDFTIYPCPLEHKTCTDCFDSRADSIAGREFEEMDLSCVLCEDYRVHPRRFVTMIKTEEVRDRMEIAVVRMLEVVCQKCNADLGLRMDLIDRTKIKCYNCDQTIRLR